MIAPHKALYRGDDITHDTGYSGDCRCSVYAGGSTAHCVNGTTVLGVYDIAI